MSLDQKVGALTASLRSEFWKSWQETARPAPHEKFTTVVPSTTKIENYINFAPVPGVSEWLGNRNYSGVDSLLYSVQNKTWHTGFRAKLEDVEDDQTGGLTSKPKELVLRCKKFPGRRVLKTLALGNGSTMGNGFDGVPFFNTSHQFGTGNNLLSFSAANADGSYHKLAALYFGDEVLKPMIWQNRSAPELKTNSGTPSMYESRQVRWWSDLRGIAAYGWWWNAVMVQITGLPSITEMHSIFVAIDNAFMSFILPRTGSGDGGDGEFVHEQTDFDAANMMYVSDPSIKNLLMQALNQDWVPQSAAILGGAAAQGVVADTNLWKGRGSFMTSNFFNTNSGFTYQQL